MEICDSQTRAYGFTIKALGNKDIKPEGYSSIINQWSKYGLVECHYYEKDSHNKWHVHGIILLRKGFLRTKLRLVGMNIKLDELYNRAGWEKYITMDQKFNLFDPKYEPIEEKKTCFACGDQKCSICTNLHHEKSYLSLRDLLGTEINAS